MAPNFDSDDTTGSSTTDEKNTVEKERPSPDKPREIEIVWFNVVFMILLHIMALYGIILLPRIKFLSILWAIFCHFFGGVGITMGAHRLWAHRSYKAKWPLRFLLMLANSMAAQNHILEWARDHRVHHKFSETDADPHNAKRGFFFSHVGWLLQRKHPDVTNKGKGLDLSDLYADEIVMFQRRYYKTFSLAMCVVVPTIVPYLWGESLWLSYFTAFALRYMFTLHATWSINSFAHLYGNKPYDVNINPSESNFTIYISSGEGYHNYHHTFPHDYSASEHGTLKHNLTTGLIHIFASIGWAYDLKSIPKEVIIQRMKRTGILRDTKSE